MEVDGDDGFANGDDELLLRSTKRSRTETASKDAEVAIVKPMSALRAVLKGDAHDGFQSDAAGALSLGKVGRSFNSNSVCSVRMSFGLLPTALSEFPPAPQPD
jgi:hypothetical protein